MLPDWGIAHGAVEIRLSLLARTQLRGSAASYKVSSLPLDTSTECLLKDEELR